MRESAVDEDSLDRATVAAKSIAESLGLAARTVTVVSNSNKLGLRLLPCDVFVRVATLGEQVAAFEIEIVQQLVAAGAPAVPPEVRVEPIVHERDGFAMTWWTFIEAVAAGPLSSTSYAHALGRLHVGMRSVELSTPHFLDRVREAEHLVNNRNLTPALASTGRRLLIDTFGASRRDLERSGAAEQILHGEPHPGNILNAPGGPLFIDFETCCRGPLEFDIAHVPVDVAAHYPSLDEDLLRTCRRLVLAMVAAWRWDANDEFPDGLRHGQNILDVLGNGPPWPTMNDLSTT